MGSPQVLEAQLEDPRDSYFHDSAKMSFDFSSFHSLVSTWRSFPEVN